MTTNEMKEMKAHWLGQIVPGVVAVVGLSFQFVLALQGISLDLLAAVGGTTATIVAALMTRHVRRS